MSPKESQIMAEKEMERKISTLAIGWIGIFFPTPRKPEIGKFFTRRKKTIPYSKVWPLIWNKISLSFQLLKTSCPHHYNWIRKVSTILDFLQNKRFVGNMNGPEEQLNSQRIPTGLITIMESWKFELNWTQCVSD